MNVILDTNILYADFNLSGNAFRIFIEGMPRISAEVFIPQVVLDETVAKYRQRIESVINAVNRSTGDFKQLTRASQDTLAITQSSQDLTKEYESYLAKRLDSIGATIVPYPDTPHPAIVQRALLRRKPFKESGDGYRDTLIWESVLAVAKTSKGQVVFVTNNAKDFGIGPEVPTDLLQDLRERGLKDDSVQVFGSLEALNQALVIPTLARLNKLAEEFANERVGALSVVNWAQTNLAREINRWGWDCYMLGLDQSHGTTSIKSLKIMGITYDDVRVLPSSNLLVSATAKAELDIDVEVDWDDYVHEEGVRELFSDAQDRLDWGPKMLHVESSVAFTLVVEDETYQVLSSEIDEIEGETPAGHWYHVSGNLHVTKGDPIIVWNYPE